MVNNKFPTKLLENFTGNPLQSGQDLSYLHNDNILSFVKCYIFVDSSIKRPIFQTKIKLNN
jgi:hypothetical protein